MRKLVRTGGGSTLVEKASTWMRGLKAGSSTLLDGFGILGRAGLVGQVAIKYISHQLRHFLQGSMFLFTLGAIGTAFGDGGLFAEIAFQALLAASIIVSLGQRKYMNSMNELDSNFYAEAANELKTEGAKRGFFGRKLYEFKAQWSIYGDWGNPKLQQSFRMLIALNFAAVGLQFATVATQVYG